MNELIRTSNNDNVKNLLVAIEESVIREVEVKSWKLLGEMLEILNSYSDNAIEAKFELLKLDIRTMDYFDLVILDSFLEGLFKFGVIDENLTDNKRIPSGSNNAYGNYFERFIVKVLKSNPLIEVRKSFPADAIVGYENQEYILEVKCSKTNTSKQIGRYKKLLKNKKFITVNGHENSFDFTFLTVKKIASEIFEEVYFHSIKKEGAKNDNR